MGNENPNHDDKDGKFASTGEKSNKPKKKRVVKLSKQEYAKVMSEVRTNAMKQDKEDGTFVKYIGNHKYRCDFEDDDFDIIGKKEIE